MYFHSKGLAYQQLNDVKTATALFSRALELDPQYAPSLYHIALMYHATSQFAKSIDAFSEVIRLGKADRRVYESRGMVFQDLLDHSRAIEDFTMAIKLGPDFPVDYFHRGESYLRLAQYELAIQDFDVALSTGPEGTCVLLLSLFLSFSLSFSEYIVL